jgi:hypothetical protein
MKQFKVLGTHGKNIIIRDFFDKLMSTTGTGNPERIYNSRLTGDIFHQKMLLW